MTSQYLIANLDIRTRELPTISFHDIEVCTQRNSSKLSGHYHTNYGSTSHSPRYNKAIERGHKIAARAIALLNAEDTEAASLKLTSAGLVGGAPGQGDVELIEDIRWYEKVVFEFHHPLYKVPKFESTNYLHFSSPSAQIIPDGFNLKSFTIITGTCLFSENILQSSVPGGRSIDVEKLQQAPPTIYEVEYIARLSPVIADFVALLHNMYSCAGQGPQLSLCLDIPNFHYYQTVEQPLKDGICTFGQALRWLDAVEKRHAQIATILRLYISHLLFRRNVSPLSLQVQVTPSSDWICSHLRKSLASNVFPTIEPYLQRLVTDPIWQLFYSLIPDNEKPQDIKALGYLFYVYQVVRPALVENHACIQDRKSLIANSTPILELSQLIIGIDDGVERRIYSQAQKVLKRLRNLPAQYPVPFNLLEVYLCRRVFLDMNQSRSNLYVKDPTPIQPIVIECPSVTAQSELSSSLDPFEIVARLHGQGASTKLKELFRKVKITAAYH